ncbi:MAG: GNAT family N-acetyltransferase [Chloroflexi bacterium]|nr:GNAT family N-acetyltransferase [Chloroflexota bacterium]
MSDRTIQPLDGARLEQSGALLGRAFTNDPVYAAILPDALARLEQLTWLNTRLLRFVLRRGLLYTTTTLEGVLGCLTPEHPSLNAWDVLTSGLLSTPQHLGQAGCRRLRHYNQARARLRRTHAPRPHWYFFVLGVDPLYQGTGIGTRLMQRALADAAAAGAGVYVEATTLANARFYERLGLERLAEGELPGSAVPFWTLGKAPPA